MTRALAAALAVAALNVAATRAINARTRFGGASFWRLQALGFAFRFATLFGVATWIWLAARSAGRVAAFVVAAALAQLAGQTYYLLRQQRSNRLERPNA